VREPKRAFAKTSWTTKKTNLALCEDRDESLLLASSEATSVSSCETILALHKAKPHFSHEAKAKAPLGASATLALNEVNLASLKSKAPLSSAKLASSNKDKILSAKITCQAKLSHMAKLF